jgi:hypothetical protein
MFVKPLANTSASPVVGLRGTFAAPTRNGKPVSWARVEMGGRSAPGRKLSRAESAHG